MCPAGSFSAFRGQSGVMGFTASLAEKTDAEPAVVVPRHRVARRLFAARGLVIP